MPLSKNPTRLCLPLFRLGRLFAAVSSTALATAALAAAPIRPETSLVAAWKFHFGDTPGIEQASTAPSDWFTVTLPHTWNATDGADGGTYARGTAWYIRPLTIDPSWQGKRIFLQFDGASRVATVFINGHRIGEHVGGFARFRFDLTDAVRFDGPNTLAVRVSNADDGTAPVTADFTFFGGLYRAVTVFATDPLHVDSLDYASSGIYVTPKQVSAARADFSVTAKLRNDSSHAERVLVRIAIRDGAGALVTSRDLPQELGATSGATCTQEFSLATPHLWNAQKDPHQYTATVTIAQNGTVRDEVSQSFGLRSFSVDPDKGFFLNGAHLDLHGICRHQDRAGKGWAINEADEREDFAFVREIGATAIRVAHYPQSSLWFDFADEAGLVVWAEIPVVNEVLPGPRYTENAREQLRELIRQNYNRPAICFWGVGNETREVGETSGRAQVNGPEAARVIADLAALARVEDPTRLSVYASHHRAEDQKNFHTDVLAFNKYFGWYTGKSEDFATWADDVHRRYPALRFGISEYGAGANVLQHETSGQKPTPGGAWHPEEYQARYHEIHWAAMRGRDYLWSKFIWNLFDFASDQRSEGEQPGINDKGLVTYDRRTRKDAFYWYQANWATAPMIHLVGHRFSNRPVGKNEIKAYSNAPEVELFLNGVSCGKVTANDHLFHWEVPLVAGANRLVARAKTAAGELTDEFVLSGQTIAKP